jgi:hypothetical protein
MKWARTRLDEHIARVVRYDQQFIKGYRIGEEFGIDRWYAVCMWRDDFQKETCCPHSHRSEETAERCSRRLQSTMVKAVRQSKTSPLVLAPECICEIDRHDFNCPVHNDNGPSRRGPNGDE